MATGKKYYWIKLKTSFITSDKVDFLMSQKDGANYVVLYQMLCLKAINSDGELSNKFGEVIIPYDADKIQRDCKYFSKDTILVALELYKKLGMVYADDNGVLTITDFADMVGSESDYAKQKRMQRETKQLSGHKVDSSVDIVHTEKEIEKEIELDKIYSRADTTTYQEIIAYLNDKLGTHYKHTSKSTQRLINARLNENFTVEDFKRVIDNKYDSWHSDRKMKDFLRPQTLFGTKFESYLNEKVADKIEMPEYDPMERLIQAKEK